MKILVRIPNLVLSKAIQEVLQKLESKPEVVCSTGVNFDLELAEEKPDFLVIEIWSNLLFLEQIRQYFPKLQIVVLCSSSDYINEIRKIIGSYGMVISPDIYMEAFLFILK